MNKLIKVTITSLAVSLLAAGCASKVQYGDARAVETVDEKFGSTDLQAIAEEMVESMLTFPPVLELTKEKRPVLFVDKVKNKTTDHIDTESITDTIVNKALRSGKFQFIDMSAMAAVEDQLDYQQDSGLVNPAKAVQIGKQTGAEYMVYGNLSSIVKKNKKEKDVYYKFTLKMVGLESGLLVWQDEKEIRKSVSRSLLGL